MLYYTRANKPCRKRKKEEERYSANDRKREGECKSERERKR